MANTPCTIKHVRLIEVYKGVRYTGPIDREGMHIEDSQQGEADFGKEERTYFCTNCLMPFDGSETFDVVKAHFGTFPLTD